ncbi:hypothetical protein Tco_0121255 [Tanacetum coccineum]
MKDLQDKEGRLQINEDSKDILKKINITEDIVKSLKDILVRVLSYLERFQSPFKDNLFMLKWYDEDLSESSKNNKEYIVTEASVRSKLQLADATGINNLPDADIYEGLTTLGGYVGDFVPLLPAMLAGAAPDQGEGSTIPAELEIPQSQEPTFTTRPDEATTTRVGVDAEGATTTTSGLDAGLDSGNIHESPLRSHDTPLHEGHTSGSVEDSEKLQELMVLVPKLKNKVDSLEKELKETKQTLGSAILKLVKKVKSLEVALKRKSKKVVVSDSEDEETKAQGKKIQELDDDPLVSLVKDFVTPTKTTVSASGEEQVEDISPTTMEAAKTLSKVASQKAKSVDKGRRYKRRKVSKGKDISTGLEAEVQVSTGREELNTGSIEINTGSEDFNSGGLEVNTGTEPVSAPSRIPSPDKGQRKGKAPMTTEEEIQASKRTKAQIQQEEAGLAEALRLQILQEEEVARQIYLDELLAKRIQEEEELSEQQKKRKAEVQEAAQHYTEEDWDTIRTKLEANAEPVKSLQGESITGEDFDKRMVEMINKKKKFYAEQKARAKRSKPMTQAQQREYMSTFIKNQSTWKLTQLKKLTFEELKSEFEKLVRSLKDFVPMERVKRQGVQLKPEQSKKQKIEDVPEEKIVEPMKKKGKRKKQIARKGKHIDKSAQDEGEEEREAYMKDKVKDASPESEEGIDAIPTDIKPPSIVDWKIIPQAGLKCVYQIIRRDGTDKIYTSFGAILKDFSRDELTELYRLVMKKYGENRPKEMYESVLWGDLKTMYDPPLSEDAIWSLPHQQRTLNWSYYPSCAVHCLTLEASRIYMLADRKYPLSQNTCQVMLQKKFLGGVQDEVCY